MIHFDELGFLIKTGWITYLYLQVFLHENKLNYLCKPLLFRSILVYTAETDPNTTGPKEFHSREAEKKVTLAKEIAL